MSTKKRPLGVTLLAILAVIAALVSFYDTLQFLEILPFSLGPLEFFGFSLLGAFFAGVLGLIYLWVARSLWNLRPEGWLFSVSISAISLIFAVLAIIGQSSFQAMLPAIVVYGLILLYCLIPGVRAAFQPAPASMAAAAPAAAPARTAAAEPAAPPAAPAEDAAMRSEPAAAEMTRPGPSAGAAAAAMAATAMLDDSDDPEPEPVMDEPPAMATAVAGTAMLDNSDEPEPEPAMDEPAPMAAAPAADAESMAGEPAMETVPVAAERSSEAEPSAPAASRKMRVDEIEGIGPAYAETLAQAGIHTTEDLLEAGSTPSGRDRLVQATGLSNVNLLKWINMADLMRVPGIGVEYSQLLEVAGVDTVKELRMRNPANLHKALLDASETGNLVRRPPHLSEVEAWVEAAGKMEARVSY